MKRIEAVIRTEKVVEVKEALASLGHLGITVLAAHGHGIQGGITQQWRGMACTADLLPKSVVIAVVHDHELQDCVDMLIKAARTDMIGDGKVFVTDVEQVIRVRTGERDSEAL